MKEMGEESIDDRILEAMRLNDEGRLKELEAVVLDLAKELQEESGPTFLLLATYLRRLGRLEESIAMFKRRLKVDPFSERASMGLFHGLWNSGRYSEAFDELERFLKHRAEGEHVSLLLDWKKEFSDELPESFKYDFPKVQEASKSDWMELFVAVRAFMEPELSSLQDKK